MAKVQFLIFTASRPVLGSTQPPIQWVPGVLSPRVKQQGHEADHSPLSSAEVRNGGAIPPLTCMSSWRSAYLLRHRDNFTFLPVLLPGSDNRSGSYIP
jgi:hypothetical protein